LPEPLVKAVTWDMNPRTGFSVTDLIQPPRITQLTRRHWDEIEIDASDRIWVLLGSAIHYILEHGETPDSEREKPLTAEIDNLPIVGRPDLSHQLTTWDYKITSAWSMVFESEGRTDWHAQLNLYRWLRLKNNLPTEKLQVCAILRDWQQSKAYDANYPPIPVAIIDIPIWPDEKVESYLKERIRMHLEAEKLPDDELPLCTTDDMWSKPTTYAIMKPNRKTAVRVCYSREEAEQKMFEGEYIVERPGKRSRCLGYCDVRAWCNQFKEYKNTQSKPTSDIADDMRHQGEWQTFAGMESE
jgi:hypothetical protein